MMQITPNDPVGRHVIEAGLCFEAGDVDGCDNAYGKAVQESADRPSLREEVQEDHVSSLMELGKRALALTRCEEYLDECPPGPLGLRVLRAEILTALGDPARADAEALAISRDERELSEEQVARLHRVRGLALANDGRRDQATRYLAAARKRFEELRLAERLAQLNEEIDVLLRREGYITAAIDRPPETVPDHLFRAEELRHEGRYEEALRTLVDALDLPDLEPALYWPVVREMAVLARALRRPDLVERLKPRLWEAAGQAPEPQAAWAEADSLLEPGASKDGPVARRFDARIEHIRRLLDDKRLVDAEKDLREVRDRAASPREIALWHLAAAEVEWFRGMSSPGDAAPLHECAGHAAQAVDHARTDTLLEVRIEALRILGHVFAELGLPDSDDRAVDYWAQAHRLEEEIATRQPADLFRIPMLRAARDEHDERVRMALERTQGLETPTASGIAVALEAARGALILPQILPADAHRARDLPRPSDWSGARRWVSGMAAVLPRDQAAWLIHATPHRVHHVIVSRELLLHAYVDSDRHALYEAIDDLARCWDSPETLEESVADGEFDRRLAEVALRLGVGKVTGRLPEHVRRLAAVAGNEVSNVPLAALPLPDEGGPLGLRYALSDLPCLSALAPLRERSLGLRGDNVLLVQPRDDLTPARAPARSLLSGPDATLAGLREALATHRHQIVRIDSHGIYGDDATRSIIGLSPPGAEGHLHFERLEKMDLRGCGTFLLGACESGMAQRLGRDERRGFVRAAFNAGAASVVAARWIAPDRPAAKLLDRLQRHLRALPRDLALLAAMRDVCAMDHEVPYPRNPSRWACWTLYGDSGPQTKAGPLRQRMRRLHGGRSRDALAPQRPA
ncbi:CHAT domain-containing tetratricopeptide repeat protein [Actinomadura rubrisoli]|uniref:CHAT domain-containing protein n=1 Tax=Actinomadura rubrisoli TaxID=2530368 RepID=A0A4R5C747_9ACTN|nr:CHAT domain-containing tetratricopeptide repeat protein [Actinomadura rubrisoli]TDD93943.1 CHAT domain-containing protein [Actinomadura rubrisoli]